jgi:predicted Zn-dependent peptidase
MIALRLIVALALCGAVTFAQDRSKPPATDPAPSLRLPTIVKRQLANGLPVWIVELHEVPVAQVNLLLRAGTASDPPGKYGIASLTAAMLTEGAGSRSALEIADAVDFLGADLNASSGIDSSAVRLHVPVSRLSDALPIMADVALRPTFPPEELERQRQQRLTNLLQARDDPATIASLAFSRVLYGPEHRFGTATMGTAATLKGFAAGDLTSFYRTAFRPENATLVVVGDITPDGVMPLLEKSFGAWTAPASSTAPVTMPAAPSPGQRQIYLVDKPGAPQSQIRIGTIGVARSTPDFFAIQVMNTILGGSFSSRLNLNLREKRGYTYGASSGFDMRLTPGPFSAQAGVQTDKTSESLTEFFNELNGILKTVPADELARAKNYVALRFPSSFETTGDIARRLEDAIVYRLPDDYYARYVQSIEAITAADVQRAAQKYIQPDRLAVVVVGDRKTIEPGMRALKLGTITPLTIDEIFNSR